MNQKTAKKLRKIAAQMATQPYKLHALMNSKRVIIINAKEIQEAFGKEDQKVEPKMQKLDGTMVVNPESARGIYKLLKKTAKKAK